VEMQDKISLIFIGQKNFYTEFLVDWLGQLTTLKGVIWTASDRHSKSYKARFLRRRIKRFGFVRSLSEILYYVSTLNHRRKDTRALLELVAKARDEMITNPASAPQVEVRNLRDSRAVELLRQSEPDVILTQCINEIIPESVFTLPKIGCFVYHEGLVPKYRGKFCTHWVLMNREFDQIGASLIKVGRGLDTGQVAFTEPVLPEGAGRRHGWWEHEVLYLALPRLRKWIEDVSAGRIELTDQEGVYPIYSYPLFSHLFKIGRRVREYERWRAENDSDGEGN
jgi:folate-dependent phosphoribosylglycinamide formyltransferase PurN